MNSTVKTRNQSVQFHSGILQKLKSGNEKSISAGSTHADQETKNDFSAKALIKNEYR